jgi:hypothetical protein
MDRRVEVIYISPLRKVFDNFKKPVNVLFSLLKSRRVLIILLLILASVIIVGTFLSVRQQSQSRVAAEVNGKKISKIDYKNILAAQEYFYIVVNQKITEVDPSEEFLFSLRESTMDQLIEEALLADYLAKKDVEISDDSVRQYIKENIVNETWEGDWTAYENNLEKNKSSLENITHAVRRDLLIQKVMEVEGLDADKFREWYAKLLSGADVSIFIDLDKESSGLEIG